MDDVEMTMLDEFQLNLLLLDAMLTDQPWADVYRNAAQKKWTPENFAGFAGERLYYLSDGGYSRVGWRETSGRLFLTGSWNGRRGCGRPPVGCDGRSKMPCARGGKPSPAKPSYPWNDSDQAGHPEPPASVLLLLAVLLPGRRWLLRTTTDEAGCERADQRSREENPETSSHATRSQISGTFLCGERRLGETPAVEDLIPEVDHRQTTDRSHETHREAVSGMHTDFPRRPVLHVRRMSLVPDRGPSHGKRDRRRDHAGSRRAPVGVVGGLRRARTVRRDERRAGDHVNCGVEAGGFRVAQAGASRHACAWPSSFCQDPAPVSGTRGSAASLGTATQPD